MIKKVEVGQCWVNHKGDVILVVQKIEGEDGRWLTDCFTEKGCFSGISCWEDQLTRRLRKKKAKKKIINMFKKQVNERFNLSC